MPPAFAPVTVDGEDFFEGLGFSPATSLQRGLAMVTEDRKRYGLHLDQSTGWNLTLSSLRTLTKSGGLLDTAAAHAQAEGFLHSLQIKAPGLDTPAGTLSGGNQQKIVIGKALGTRPSLLFLDEPTRGIDVGARLEIYHLINSLTAQGMAVVMVSSELPELMGMSDRILMLHEGTAGGSFQPEQFTQAVLMAAAMGRAA